MTISIIPSGLRCSASSDFPRPSVAKILKLDQQACLQESTTNGGAVRTRAVQALVRLKGGLLLPLHPFFKLSNLCFGQQQRGWHGTAARPAQPMHPTVERRLTIWALKTHTRPNAA